MAKNPSTSIEFKDRHDIEVFIQFSTNPDILNKPINDKGQTLMHVYCAEGNTQVVKFLLGHGATASILAVDENLRTPLHYACISGHKEIVNLLIKDGAIVNALDTNGETPLHFATFYGHTEVVEALLDHKASTNVCNKHNLSPLHYAAAGNYPDIIKKLFVANPELKQANDFNYSALHIASAVGSLDTSKALVEYKANVNLKEKALGWKPIDFAKLTKHSEVIKYLIDNGASNDITVLYSSSLTTLRQTIQGVLCNNKEATEFASEVSSALLTLGLGFAAVNGFQLVAQDRLTGALATGAGVYGVKKIISTISDMYSTSSFCEHLLIDDLTIDSVTSLVHAEKYLTARVDTSYLALGEECKAKDRGLTSFDDFGTKWTVCELAQENIKTHEEL